MVCAWENLCEDRACRVLKRVVTYKFDGPSLLNLFQGRVTSMNNFSEYFFPTLLRGVLVFFAAPPRSSSALLPPSSFNLSHTTSLTTISCCTSSLVLLPPSSFLLPPLSHNISHNNISRFTTTSLRQHPAHNTQHHSHNIGCQRVG